MFSRALTTLAINLAHISFRRSVRRFSNSLILSVASGHCLRKPDNSASICIRWCQPAWVHFYHRENPRAMGGSPYFPALPAGTPSPLFTPPEMMRSWGASSFNQKIVTAAAVGPRAAFLFSNATDCRTNAAAHSRRDIYKFPKASRSGLGKEPLWPFRAALFNFR